MIRYFALILTMLFVCGQAAASQLSNERAFSHMSILQADEAKSDDSKKADSEEESDDEPDCE